MATLPEPTNYDLLHELVGRLPEPYRAQSRARLYGSGRMVEGLTLAEADRRLDLRLGEHGLLPG